jgi:hypothetical protein
LKSSESSNLHTIVETSSDGRSGMCHGGAVDFGENYNHCREDNKR